MLLVLMVLGSFYHSCLDIISIYLCVGIKQFFIQSWILFRMNSNIISLIPKVQDDVFIKDFRSIVVANFRFKVISKILADRLGIVCGMVIFHNHNGFIKGVRLTIVFVLFLRLLTCCRERPRVVMLILRLIFLKFLTPLVESFCYKGYFILVFSPLL